MKLLQIFFIVILAIKRNFCTNFGVFLPQLKCPNMVMYYFDEKSMLVSAVLKIGIRDLHGGNDSSVDFTKGYVHFINIIQL